MFNRVLEHDGRAYLSVFVGLNSFVFLRSTFASCGHSPLALFLPLVHLHKVYTNALEPYQAHLTEASSALAPAFSFEAMSNPGAGAVDVTAQGISSGQRERGRVGGLGVSSALQRSLLCVILLLFPPTTPLPFSGEWIVADGARLHDRRPVAVGGSAVVSCRAGMHWICVTVSE